jgi:hypothetical protein
MAVTTGAQFLAKPTTNPLEVIQDPRVVSAGVGVLGGQALRKLAYTQFRGVFGHASKEPDGMKYYAVDSNNQPIVTQAIPGAFLNRILWNLFTVATGSLLIGVSDDPNLDYVGLGIAAGGSAAVVQVILGID